MTLFRCVLCGVALGVAMCAASEPVFELKEQSQRVTVQVRQPFLVKIPAQISTGYSWRLSPKPETVKQLEASVESDDNVAAGADQVQVFKLVIMEPGTQKLTFVYGRPFGQQDKSAEVRNIIVTAHLGQGRAEPDSTVEEVQRLRAEEERAMAATAHMLIIHAQGKRGPLVSSTEEWHKIACLNGYAALRQCFPENLRNQEDEEFFKKKIVESKVSLLIAKVLEQYGAVPILQLLEECASKSESSGKAHPQDN